MDDSLLSNSSQKGSPPPSPEFLQLKFRLASKKFQEEIELREKDLRKEKEASQKLQEKITFLTKQLEEAQKKKSFSPPSSPMGQLTDVHPPSYSSLTLPPLSPVSEPVSPQVDHLTNTISNLKWGFKKSESKMRQQLQLHQQALHFLYNHYTKTKSSLKTICLKICEFLDFYEELSDQNKLHSGLVQQLNSFIGEILQVENGNLKEPDAKKLERDKFVIQTPHIQKDTVDTPSDTSTPHSFILTPSPFFDSMETPLTLSPDLCNSSPKKINKIEPSVLFQSMSEATTQTEEEITPFPSPSSPIISEFSLLKQYLLQEIDIKNSIERFQQSIQSEIEVKLTQDISHLSHSNSFSSSSSATTLATDFSPLDESQRQGMLKLYEENEQLKTENSFFLNKIDKLMLNQKALEKELEEFTNKANVIEIENPQLPISSMKSTDDQDRFDYLLFGSPELKQKKSLSLSSPVPFNSNNNIVEEEKDEDEYWLKEIKAMEDEYSKELENILHGPPSNSPQPSATFTSPHEVLYYKKKVQEIEESNKSLLRELDLYKSEIFTTIETDKKNLSENFNRRIPDINYSFLIGNSTEIINPETPTPHIIYIIQQLVNNNNSLLDKVKFYEIDQLPMLQSQLESTINSMNEIRKEKDDRENDINILKRLLSQASSTINNTEGDYELLRREISLVTDKVSALMDENHLLKSKLSQLYHSASLTPLPVTYHSIPHASISSTIRPNTPNSTNRMVYNPTHSSYNHQ